MAAMPRHRQMPRTLHKLLKAISSSTFEIVVCAVSDHPPDVAGVIEEHPLKCPFCVFAKAYGRCHSRPFRTYDGKRGLLAGTQQSGRIP